MSDEDVKMVAVDGKDALFGLIIRPLGAGMTVEVFGNGMSKREAARVLRTVADGFEEDR